MAPKIKNLNDKKKMLRRCNLCGKMVNMEKNQRFCSATCRQMATDIDKHGNEHTFRFK